jgi:hypothetical protein
VAHIAPKYTVEERDAMGIGMVDRGMSAHEVKAAAEAGLLERSDGTRIPPFEPPVASIRHYARVVKQRRAGKARSEADKLPPRDAVESFRIRLVRNAGRAGDPAHREAYGDRARTGRSAVRGHARQHAPTSRRAR